MSSHILGFSVLILLLSSNLFLTACISQTVNEFKLNFHKYLNILSETSKMDQGVFIYLFFFNKNYLSLLI